MTWLLDSSPLPLSPLEEVCDKAVSVSYHVEERVDHFCYSTYTVSVQICAADSSVGGEYVVVVGGEGGEVLQETELFLRVAYSIPGGLQNT